jgi:hypothetical protein
MWSNQFLTLWDFVLAPIYLVILSTIAIVSRNKKYPIGHPLRKYFLKGLFLKFLGAIFIALIYQYYYGGGDTNNFFYHARVINSSINNSWGTWYSLMTHKTALEDPKAYSYISQMWWYDENSSYTVARIAAFFGLFCGTAYLPIALMFAYISFTGMWAMYKTFVSIYPKITKELAFAFLFIPSTIVWGSGLFKDTICMFGLGWLTYCTFRIFVNKDYSFRNILLLVFSFWLIAVVKIYIMMAFIPALAIWLLTTYTRKISSSSLRFLLRLGFIGLTIMAFFFFTQVFADQLNKYSLDRIEGTATETRWWLTYASGDEGSSYDLGEFDPSIGGMILKFPQAVVVTLFRPFPWEAKKMIVLLSAAEALLFVFFTIQAFRKRGLGKTIQLIRYNPTLLFCLVFSLIFAFAVGITSFNFGALSRYKIPCLPFYGAFLMIIIHFDKLTSSSSLLRNQKQMARKISQRAR